MEDYFWNQGLTDNHLVITLGRNKIKMIRNYLNEVTKSKSRTRLVNIDMI